MEMEEFMPATQLKLKQASAVLGVAPKELQNFVQHRVLRPRRRADVFWFDSNLLLQAKVAFYVKASLRPSTEYLAQLTKEISRVDLVTTNWDDLLLRCSPGKGKFPMEIKIPLGELRKELEEAIPLADAVRDLPRGRKRPGWKDEFLTTLRQAGGEIGEISQDEILNTVRAYRSERKKQPEIRLVPQESRSA
jgi:hypothetical protein